VKRRYLRELLLLQVLGDLGVEVLRVAFVQTVDLSLLLDLHVSIHQDELTDGLKEEPEIQKDYTYKYLKDIYI